VVEPAGPAGPPRSIRIRPQAATGFHACSLKPEALTAARAGMLIACSRFLTDRNGKVVCGHALSGSLH
jgi:hypothetical protein